MAEIDNEAIEAITSLQQPGKPDLFGKIYNLFEQNSPGMIASIEQSLVDADAESARAAAHSLKSSAAYVGAVELSDLCKKIEAAAREDQLSDAQVAIERISACYSETVEALQPYLQKAA